MKPYQYLSIILTATVFLFCGCGEGLEVEGISQEEQAFLSDWTEHLPEWESQWGPFDGKLTLKENEWLAIKAEHYYDMGAMGTFLIRDKGEVRFLRDKIIEDTGIISFSEPHVMRGWNSEWQPIWDGKAKSQGYRYGVYRLSDDRWILEPQYDYIDNSEPDFYYSIGTSASDSAKDLYSFYGNDWNLLWSKELGHSAVFRVNGEEQSYIWIMDLDGVYDGVSTLTTSIYDSKGELVRTLNTPSLIENANGAYNGWFGEGKLMCIRSEKDDWCIYDSDGSFLFDSSQIPDSIRVRIRGEGGNDDGAEIKVTGSLLNGRLVILEGGGQNFLYDTKDQELLSGSEDILEWNNNGQNNLKTPQAVTVISPDGGRIIYRYERSSPETSQGLPYLYLAGGAGEDERQYYYRIDDGIVTLGDGEGMEYTYQGNYDENTLILPYEGKIILLKNSDGDTDVYLEEELVMSGTDLEIHYNMDYSIENRMTGERILLDEDGNYHKGQVSQSVSAFSTGFTVTREEDTLFSVMDGDGRPVVRLPETYRYPIDGSHDGY